MSYEALKAAWIRACKRAGITDLRVNDLRHTAATRMGAYRYSSFILAASFASAVSFAAWPMTKSLSSPAKACSSSA